MDSIVNDSIQIQRKHKLLICSFSFFIIKDDNYPESLFRKLKKTFMCFFLFPILIKSLTCRVHRCFGM